MGLTNNAYRYMMYLSVAHRGEFLFWFGSQAKPVTTKTPIKWACMCPSRGGCFVARLQKPAKPEYSFLMDSMSVMRSSFCMASSCRMDFQAFMALAESGAQDMPWMDLTNNAYRYTLYISIAQRGEFFVLVPCPPEQGLSFGVVQSQTREHHIAVWP